MGHARKERVVLFGTDQRITSGPAAKRPHSKAEYMTAPERFADSQIPLAPRAPSIHDTTVWFGLMAPAGTPQPIIDKLYSETARVLAQNDVRKHLQDRGMEIVANTPPEFAAIIKSEIPQWAKLIKDAGISVNE
jgi:tripartite-type tricarboxylate transporter receptor subunit TctC